MESDGIKYQFETAVEVEKQFYSAFASFDLQKMEAVWADEGVICIHPGGGPCVDKPAIMQSWQEIFSSAGGFGQNTRCEVIRVSASRNLAVHVVREILSPNQNQAAIVFATNVYRYDTDGWKMIEHHGSQPMVHRRTTQAVPESKPTLQ